MKQELNETRVRAGKVGESRARRDHHALQNRLKVVDLTMMEGRID